MKRKQLLRDPHVLIARAIIKGSKQRREPVPREGGYCSAYCKLTTDMRTGVA